MLKTSHFRPNLMKIHFRLKPIAAWLLGHNNVFKQKKSDQKWFLCILCLEIPKFSIFRFGSFLDPPCSVTVSNFDPKIEPACSANTILGKSYRVLGFIFEGSGQNTEFKILSHFDLIFDKKWVHFDPLRNGDNSYWHENLGKCSSW